MIYLNRSDHPEVLQVNLSATMPNFKDYLARMNEGDWEVRPTHFNWKLRGGENQLRVKAINKFG